jgi:WXG100 family type VII secretion target
MDLIHVEPEELRSAGRACEFSRLDFEDSLQEIRSAAMRLEANWQGGAAESFEYELGQWLRVMAELIEQAGWFARTLARQAEGWEETDQRWTGAFRDARAAVPKEAVRA